MADTTHREEIITTLVAALEGMSGVKIVKRELPFDAADLQRLFPSGQTPGIAVGFGLPEPEKYASSPTGDVARVPVLVRLEGGVALYGSTGKDDVADTVISAQASEMLRILHAPATYAAGVVAKIVTPDPIVYIKQPYYGFGFDITVTYKPTNDTI
jgi:hypothetical protein